MDLGFESFSSRFGRTAASPVGQPCDWQVLHARLATAHVARRALLAEFATEVPLCGSFDPLAVQALSALEEDLMTVNLTALADGKPYAGKELDVAPAQVSGGQGT
jgi:hypothetical protein